ncbi:MAG TPA: conjugative transposon protein TraK [Chitinophagaceae bacterium]|nr:conjugative transposon protein TraK [Chitinophagaceae bacterium]
MLTHWKDIDLAFRYIRSVSLMLILACLTISLVSVYSAYRFSAQLQSRIYLLSGGKVLQAYASDRKNNLAVEARDEIRMFHHYFFTLDPDQQVIQDHLSRALDLADASARRMYDNLRESGYYANLISGNISQRVKEDSISLDLDQYPYYFRYYATQLIIRTSVTVTRNLITQGYLRLVSRSDHDPHGLLIERWQVLSNTDQQTKIP